MQKKRFWSDTYQRFLQFKVTTSVIKEVGRLAGGIDEYLRKTPNSQLLFPKAIKIKRNQAWEVRRRDRVSALAELEAATGEGERVQSGVS